MVIFKINNLNVISKIILSLLCKDVNTCQNSRSYCIFLSVYSKAKRDKVIKDIKRDKRDNEKEGRIL